MTRSVAQAGNEIADLPPPRTMPAPPLGFNLDVVARRCFYLDRIGETKTLADLIAVIRQFRGEIQDTIKPWKSLTM